MNLSIIICSYMSTVISLSLMSIFSSVCLSICQSVRIYIYIYIYVCVCVCF